MRSLHRGSGFQNRASASPAPSPPGDHRAHPETHIRPGPLLRTLGLPKSFLVCHPGQRQHPLVLGTSPSDLALCSPRLGLGIVTVCQLHDSEDYLFCPLLSGSGTTPRTTPGTVGTHQKCMDQAEGPHGQTLGAVPGTQGPCLAPFSLPTWPTPAGLS